MALLLLQVLGFAQSPPPAGDAVAAVNKAARQQIAEQHYAAAIESCKRAIALNPENVEAWHGLGEAYASLGKPAGVR